MKAIHRHAWRVLMAAMKSLASVTSTTLITVTAFMLSAVIGPVAHAAAMPTPGVAQAVRASLGTFQIPASVGRITDAQYFGSSKVVVAVQDLHCQPDVQRNIARVLGILEEQWGARAGMNVFVEGGIGGVNTSWVEKFADARERRDIVETFLNAGRLTGAEYFAVQTGRHTLLQGLEEPGLYFDNLARLNSIMDIRAGIAENMRTLEAAFADVKQEYYAAGNIRLDRLEARHRAGALKDARYYRTLLKMAGHQYVDVRNYPAIISFLDIAERQRGLRPTAINRDLSRLIGTLKQKLSFDDYSRLIQQLGRPGGTDEVCMAIARVPPGLDLSAYPALAKYFTFIEKNAAFNPLALVREERVLRGELRASLSRSRAEREVAFLADFLDVTRAYYENRASADDYAYFSKYAPAFRHIWARYSRVELLPALDAYTELFARYYQVNVERNRVFMTKIGAGAVPLKSSRAKLPVKDSVRLIQDQLSGAGNGATVSVVVTGGFHTQGMADLLRSAGISYVVVTPHVSGGTAFARRMYDIFARESVPQAGPAPAAISSAVVGPDQSALALYAESTHFADMTADQIRQRAIDVQLQSAAVSASLARMSAPHIAEQLLQSARLRGKFKDITADGTAVTFHFADGHRISVNVADDAEQANVAVHKPGSGLILPSTNRIGRWFIKMIGKDATWSEEKKIQFIEQRFAPWYFPDIIIHTVLLMVGQGQPNKYRILGAASIWAATLLSFAVVGMVIPGIHQGLAIAVAAAVNAVVHSRYNKKFGSFSSARSPLSSDTDESFFHRMGLLIVGVPLTLWVLSYLIEGFGDFLYKFIYVLLFVWIGGSILAAFSMAIYMLISPVLEKIQDKYDEIREAVSSRADKKRRAALINQVTKMVSLERYDVAETEFRGQHWDGKYVKVYVSSVLDAIKNSDKAALFLEMLMGYEARNDIRCQALRASVRFPQKERLADALVAAAKDESDPDVQTTAFVVVAGGAFHHLPQIQDVEKYALDTLVSRRGTIVEKLGAISPTTYLVVSDGYDDSNYYPHYYTDGAPAGERVPLSKTVEIANQDYYKLGRQIETLDAMIIPLQKLVDGTGHIAAGLSAEELVAERSRIRSGSDNVAVRHRDAVSAVWQTLNDIVRDERQSAAVRDTAVRTQFRLEPVQWMVSRVYDEEQYLLGHELTFAVDVVERILRVQDSQRREALLKEYVLHEIMEGMSLKNDEGRALEGKEKHDRIISLTAERHEGRNGTTALGQFLRGFIDERAAAMRLVLDRTRRFVLARGPLDIAALRRAASDIAAQPADYFPVLRGMHVVIAPRVTENLIGDAVRRANATGADVVVFGAIDSSAAGEYTAIPGTDLARSGAETTSGSVTIISYPRGTAPEAALMQQSLDASARLLRGEWLAGAREDARLSRFMKYVVEPSIAVIELGGSSFTQETLDILASPSPRRPVIVAGAGVSDAREALYDGALWEASSNDDYLSQLQYLNDRAVRATASYTAPLPGIAAISPVRILSVEDINRLDNATLINNWRAGQIDTVLFEVDPAAWDEPAVLSRLHGLGDTLRLNGIRMGFFVDIDASQAPAPALFHAMAATAGGGFGAEVIYVRNGGNERTPAPADYIQAVQQQVHSANPDAVVLVEGSGAEDSRVVTEDVQGAPRFILATPDNLQQASANAAHQAQMIILDRAMTREIQQRSIADVPENSARNVWLRLAARFREARMQDPAWRYEQGHSDGLQGTLNLPQEDKALLTDGINKAVRGDTAAAGMLRRAILDYRAAKPGTARVIADHFRMSLRGSAADEDYLMGCVAGLLEHAFSRETVTHHGAAVPLTAAMMQVYGRARLEQWLPGASASFSGDPLAALKDSPVQLLRDTVARIDPAAMTPAQLEGASLTAINALMAFARAADDPVQQQIALSGSIELLRLYGEREIPETLAERTGDVLKTELLRSMLGAA